MRIRVTGAAVSVVLTFVLGVSLAACGSSSSSTSSASSQSGSSNTSTTAGSSSPGVATATAYVKKYTPNPTSIGLPPMPAKPPSGKTVIALLVTPQPVALRVSNASADAAKALGWNYSTVDAGSTEGSAVSAFQAALQKHPDAICICGFPNAFFTKEIAQAKQEGIGVLQSTTADGPTAGVIANVGGAGTEAAYGKLTAAYFVSNSGGTGKAAVFNIKLFPILAAYTSAFEAAVKTFCSGCSVQYQDQQLTDVGTKTPQNVVSFFQRNPSYKWAVFGNGDLSTGVHAALTTAGLSGLNVIGEVPDQANIEAIKAGTETAWTGYPIAILGWARMDALARWFQHAPVAPAANAQLPLQILTKDNIGNAVVDSSGNYQAVANYQDQFKKLWHLSQ
jgi:ribose transport system substrate-binding protein